MNRNSLASASRALPLAAAMLFPWLGLPAVTALANSPDKPPAADNSVEAELASFSVHEDFKVSLFADEKLGIANPIAIQWDPRGRLWVLCTLAYAQLKPDERPDDKLFILEDIDGDGRADKSTVFAAGLDMPTGLALGHGGVYLAEGADLVFLRDTDGDGRADERKVILTGFGTGDTHQNINNLFFDEGGFLYFGQGLHIFSQVETPWGISRGDTAGFWRFDPRITRLDPFCFPSMTGQNPWGIATDRWGALFVKSNSPHLCFATPGLIPTTRPRELMQYAQVGQTPGKSMAVAIVESAHQPDWIQGHAIIAGYFAREVSAIPLVAENSGFAVSPPVRLIYGGHESFRPVDIRMGPDGGIYVVDWFNPIINHYQVSLRHPDRDYTHGRIWRVTAKDRPLIRQPDLMSLTPSELFAQLRSGERWTRDQARRLLIDHRDPETVTRLLTGWIESLDPGDEADSHALFEAAGILESYDKVSPAVLDRLQASVHSHARAAAARILSRTTEPVPDARERLARLLRDPHPRPRLEAVVACANRSKADSLILALTALDSPVDKFIDYSLKQAVFALESQWLPAVRAGELRFESPEHLAFALETYGGDTAAELTRAALAGELSDGARNRLLAVLARVGNASDLGQVLAKVSTDREGRGAPQAGELLGALVSAWESRKVKPEGPVEPALEILLQSREDAVRITAIRLAGYWKATGLVDEITQIALEPGAPAATRSVALSSLARLRGKAAASSFLPLVQSAQTPKEIRGAAMEALAIADLRAAAEAGADLVKGAGSGGVPTFMLTPLLSQPAGSAALAAAFERGGMPDSRVAQEILNALNQVGRSHPKLTPLLNQAIGMQAGAPEYDPARVAAIVAAVKAGKADPARGQAVYQMAQLSCVACHRIGDAGGVIGPPLSNVGAGMPLDQIVESILWPERQIKEGYQAVSLTMKDGNAIIGYLEREGDDVIWYRNTTTPWILPLQRKDIADRKTIPTLMPAGLTNSLTEEQLRDLVAYLASLKG